MSADLATTSRPEPPPEASSGPAPVVIAVPPEPVRERRLTDVSRGSLGLSDDTWARLGSLLAIAVGFSDLWFFHALGTTGAQDFIIAGFTALGVHTMVKVRT